MKDLAPEIIENVNRVFKEAFNDDPRIAKLLKKGKETSYADAYKYAEQVGAIRAKSFKQLSSSTLPDGKMYYNIAERLIDETLVPDQKMISDYAATAQTNVNRNSNIHLKGVKPDVDQDNIDSIINKLCSSDDFDAVAWILDEPIKTFALAVVDDTIKKNAEFQTEAGLRTTITRTAESKCCPWCLDLAGTYTYPDVPKDVFARHDNCRCTLDYGVKRLAAYMHNGKAHSFRDPDAVDKRRTYAEEKTRQIRRR